MNCTDYLQLAERSVFKAWRQGIGKSTKPSLLFVVHDDTYFLWHNDNKCILTSQIGTINSRTVGVQHQSLMPLVSVLFQPEIIQVNDAGNLLIIAGPTGILVMELPARYPPYGHFGGNKELVYCRSHTLDERLLMCNHLIEVRAVKFHPGSPKGTHIMALMSDNILRLYEIRDGGVINVSTCAVGEKPSATLPGSKQFCLAMLGDVGVDFDFCLPDIADDYKSVESTVMISRSPLFESTRIETSSAAKVQKKDHKASAPSLIWPVLVLMGDGRIFRADIPIDDQNAALKSARSSGVAHHQPMVKGPLPTNFSSQYLDEEACSILILKREQQMVQQTGGETKSTDATTMTITACQIVCIANSNGRIYHCLLMSNTPNSAECNTVALVANNALLDDETSDVVNQRSGNVVDDRKCTVDELLCFESVELELGLGSNDDDSRYNCPIRLCADPATKTNRYFPVHAAGVHSITVRSANNILKYFEQTENDAGSTTDISLEDIFTEESLMEYLVCTRMNNMTSECVNEQYQLNLVVGMGVIHEPLSSLIVLLSNGEVLSIGLLAPAALDLSFIPNDDLSLMGKELSNADQSSTIVEEHVITPLERVIGEQPFVQYIEQLLYTSAPNASQPLLKLHESANPTQIQCYELIQRAAHTFRTHYLEANNKVLDEIERRVRTLRLMKECQMDDVDRIVKEKFELQQAAERIAEKYEDLKDKQDVIAKRCKSMLNMLLHRRTEPTNAEVMYLKELQRYSEKMDNYRKAFDKLKNTMSYQKLQMTNWKSQEDKQENYFSEVHDRTIKNNLEEMSQKIADMIKEVKLIKIKMNLR